MWPPATCREKGEKIAGSEKVMSKMRNGYDFRGHTLLPAQYVRAILVFLISLYIFLVPASSADRVKTRIPGRLRPSFMASDLDV